MADSTLHDLPRDGNHSERGPPGLGSARTWWRREQRRHARMALMPRRQTTGFRWDTCRTRPGVIHKQDSCSISAETAQIIIQKLQQLQDYVIKGFQLLMPCERQLLHCVQSTQTEERTGDNNRVPMLKPQCEIHHQTRGILHPFCPVFSIARTMSSSPYSKVACERIDLRADGDLLPRVCLRPGTLALMDDVINQPQSAGHTHHANSSSPATGLGTAKASDESLKHMALMLIERVALALEAGESPDSSSLSSPIVARATMDLVRGALIEYHRHDQRNLKSWSDAVHTDCSSHTQDLRRSAVTFVIAVDLNLLATQRGSSLSASASRYLHEAFDFWQSAPEFD